MTREEAVKIIKFGTEISKYPSRLTLTVAEVEEAKQMAIQALSQEPFTAEHHKVYMEGWNDGRKKLLEAMEREIAY